MLLKPKTVRERSINKSISVDCVVFGFEDDKLSVLLVERTLFDGENKLFSDYTLAGNHVYENESLDEAARRVLYDLTNLNNVFLEQFQTFGDVNRTMRKNDQLWIKAQGRDPKTRVVSVGYVALVKKSDVVLQYKGRNVEWHVVASVRNLAFDHLKIMNEALNFIRRKIQHDPSIVFELLPKKFTIRQLQSLYEVVYSRALDKRNFYRKAQNMTYIVPLGEKQPGKANKPSMVFTFDRAKYDKAMRSNSITILL